SPSLCPSARRVPAGRRALLRGHLAAAAARARRLVVGIRRRGLGLQHRRIDARDERIHRRRVDDDGGVVADRGYLVGHLGLHVLLAQAGDDASLHLLERLLVADTLAIETDDVERIVALDRPRHVAGLAHAADRATHARIVEAALRAPVELAAGLRGGRIVGFRLGDRRHVAAGDDAPARVGGLLPGTLGAAVLVE